MALSARNLRWNAIFGRWFLTIASVPCYTFHIIFRWLQWKRPEQYGTLLRATLSAAANAFERAALEEGSAVRDVREAKRLLLGEGPPST